MRKRRPPAALVTLVAVLRRYAGRPVGPHDFEQLGRAVCGSID